LDFIHRDWYSLGSPDDPTHEVVVQAIVQSVKNGINVLGMTINYCREKGGKIVGLA
jgi:hypothetical protein